MQKIEYLQVGTGRLGTLIARRYLDSEIKQSETEQSEIRQSEGVIGPSKVTYAKIDPATGLINSQGQAMNCVVERMVICISPGQSHSWQWHSLLAGILRQVKKGTVKINQLAFISSTSVYDGITSGVVSAETMPLSHSDRAVSLLKAESQVEQLSDCVHILRCSGLYQTLGSNYQKYLNILKQDSLGNDSKLRFGVDIDDVAEATINWLTKNNLTSCYSILTDGFCYLNGKKLRLESANHFLKKSKLLVNSQALKNPEKPGS